MKALTRDQIQARKEQAARFTETVQGDPERAQEIRSESLEDYAQRRRFEIANPRHRRLKMARKKTIEDYRAENADLKDQVGELEEENETLQDQLDAVADIISPAEDEDDDGEDDDGAGDDGRDDDRD
jgi:predicted RNase H-like nuclease (RuvC/YqgF family)